ncbi:MAG TPA: hypothetical protein VFY88_11515, partial [Intrasporangium sp.]|nr:hypothetical protein [Intrasporangium sp.]
MGGWWTTRCSTHPRATGARAAADALGDRELTAWCGDLIAGRVAWGDPAGPDVAWVGGRAARGWGSPGRLDDTTDY